MSDQFERELREHLAREAQETSRFPEPLRARIQADIEPRRRFGAIQQLAIAGALVLFVALLALGVMELRGFQGLNSQPAASGSPSATATAQPSPSVAPSGLGAFDCTGGHYSTGAAAAGSNLTSIRVAHHPGYDRITFQFDAGVPQYTIAAQADTKFIQDASGQTVVLAGSSGLKVVFLNSAGQGTYSGSTDLKPSLPQVVEIRQIGDFERHLSWGVGVTGPGCYRVLNFTNPGRLVIDVQTG